MSKFSYAVYPLIAVFSLAAAVSAHAQNVNDPVDQAAYGPTVVSKVSVRSRAEVHAEAVAAVKAGEEAYLREGADPKYAVLPRAKSVDKSRALAAQGGSKGAAE